MNKEEVFIWTCIVLISCLNSQFTLVVGVRTCDGDGPCRCIYNDGSGVVDISSLGNLDETPKFLDFVSSFDGQTYSYNPCFPMNEGDCLDASACKINSTKNIVMGKQSNFLWTFTGYYPMVTYSTEDGRKTEVMLLCDHNKTSPQLDVIGEVLPGTLTMNMWTQCACPNECPRIDPPKKPDTGSLTTGAIIAIVFFTLLFVYLAAGCLINYCRTKTLSKETLPNYTFWSGLFELALDGFCCIVNCGGKKKTHYNEI